MNDTVWIGIGLNVKPNDPSYSVFVDLNKYLIKKYNSKYVFNSITLQPHVNLYDIDIPAKNLEKVTITLENILKNYKEIKVSLDKVSFFNHGHIFVECLLDKPLLELEKKIVDSISKYRNEVKTKGYWDPWLKYNDVQLKNRELYGNPHTFDSYRPHFTIGFVKDNPKALGAIVANLNSKLKIKEVKFNEVSLVVHDKNEKLINSRIFSFE